MVLSSFAHLGVSIISCPKIICDFAHIQFSFSTEQLPERKMGEERAVL
uniref:Uncharacterized protein n=1 Tax=Arundo donax TaxID=35708 RepID=A0A0A9AP53_ARUDO